MNFFIITLSYGIIIGSILLSITSVNPIHSLLNLINVFITGSILLVVLKLVFFALIFLTVYLGAIAVLFLFIIIMLDIKLINENKKLINSFSFFDIISIFLLFLLLNVEKDFIVTTTIVENLINKISLDNNKIYTFDINYYWFFDLVDIQDQLEEIGIHIFEENILALLYCGILLFIAMIGAIVLTVENLKNKYLYQQEAGLQSQRKAFISNVKKKHKK
uniref:NADH-ubiquinone oxidoreductase chain 6 n=1 Tax=Cafileria marina TaxID=2557541 RepID=A0A5B9INA7_9STRA|nr:NADH dehydrogenase subunit 6 [Cafileria marina]QEF30277.1 NADH dehydrogenase subunit 6 [Cafileria marina]